VAGSVSPADFEAYAREVWAIYAEAEAIMLERVKRRLARGIEAPGWAEAKLAEITQLKREIEEVLRQLEAGNVDAAKAVLEAYKGGAQAVFDLDGGGGPTVEVTVKPPKELPVSVNRATVDTLVQQMTTKLGATHLLVLRSTLDAYREAVGQGTAAGLAAGTRNRVQVTQDVLNRFADRGITGFIDKAGRNWDLASYAEMAVRSALAQASVQGHIETLIAQGFDRAVVSDSPEECELCRPWEGKLLALTPEAAAKYNLPTVQDAIAAGLFHPNCTHRLGGYVEGVTEVGGATANPQGYEERQKQRYIERQIRKWKRRQAVALTPQEERAAKAKVKQWQAGMRQFIDDTGRLRRSDREQLRTGQPGQVQNFR
jgi:hypothetical protein